MRRAVAVVAVGIVPGALAALLVRPAPASAVPSPVFDGFSTTAIVAGVSFEGEVGASGGLLNIDGGSARVVATLDASPSGHVQAAPYEPGGGVRAVIGQVNTAAGQKVLGVPDAEAYSPSAHGHDSVETVPGRSVGPLAVVGGAATADAAPQHVTGTATGASLAVVGALTSGASTSTVDVIGDAAEGQVSQVATTSVSSFDVGGVLHLEDVTATVRITVHGDTHTAQQTLTVGGADVNGQSVTIGNDGVTAAGTPLIPGETLAQATDSANTVLTQAGISVRTVGGLLRHDNRSAAASTGGVLISITTPGLPVGGIAGNKLSVLLGGASLTEADSRYVAAPTLPPVLPPGTAGVPPSTTTTFVPGTPGTPGIPGSVAPPTLAGSAPVSYAIAGHRFTARSALVAFAIWQLISLGLPTLYALVDRRRRLLVTAT